MNGASIRGISWVTGTRRVTNEDLVAEFGTWTAKKISSKTGVSVRWLATGETTSQLSARAGEAFFAEHPGVSRESIDMLVLCTETPDYLLPATACVVHRLLGLRKTCGAFDYNLGCSGYCYGLALCKGFITSGLARRVLLVTCDLVTRHINPRDKATRPIFGDAATVTLVEESAADHLPFLSFGTDGSGADALIIPAGGTACPRSESTGVETANRFGNVSCAENLFMDGRRVLDFGVTEVPASLSALLAASGESFESVDLIVFHQATRLMLETLRDSMGIPPEKFVIDLEDTGNTVSSTIPLALARAVRAGRLKPGMKVLLSGFGVGFSWSSALVHWDEEAK